jgi:exopolysaccharide production protein ExoZ
LPEAARSGVGYAGWFAGLETLFETAPSSNRIIALEGMRGFAALLVFFVHFYALFGSYLAPHSPLETALRFGGTVGNIGVDIFFVISAFLMYGIVMRRPTPFLPYLTRRLKRLYPVFAFVFLVYVALSYAMPSQSRIPAGSGAALRYILANLAMLPGMLSIMPLITVTWSLSYEWFFYLILPLMVWAFGLRRWASGRRIAFVLTICAVQYALCIANLSSHPRLIMFGSGICLWEIVTHFDVSGRLGSKGELASIAIAVIGVAWVGVAAMNHSSALTQMTLSPISSPILFFSLFAPTLYALFFSGILNRLFSVPWLRWMGNISYSYYLIHGLTLQALAWVLHMWLGHRILSPLAILVLAGFSILTTIVVAAFLFVAIEKPLSLSPRKASTVKASSKRAILAATAPADAV